MLMTTIRTGLILVALALGSAEARAGTIATVFTGHVQNLEITNAADYAANPYDASIQIGTTFSGTFFYDPTLAQAASSVSTWDTPASGFTIEVGNYTFAARANASET